MARSTKDAWLAAEAGDLEEAEVQDVPVKGQSVKIRALSATAANAATTSAISTEEIRGQTRMKVDSVKLDIIRFQQGVVEPQFTQAEATIISGKFGKAFNRDHTTVLHAIRKTEKLQEWLLQRRNIGDSIELWVSDAFEGWDKVGLK